MNIAQFFLTQFVTMLSLATASGILLHDTHIDKAFASAANHAKVDNSSEATQQAKGRSAQPHTHAEHMKVPKQRNENPANLPKSRDRRRQAIRRQARGYHGDNVCMPLAGEWI